MYLAYLHISNILPVHGERQRKRGIINIAFGRAKDIRKPEKITIIHHVNSVNNMKSRGEKNVIYPPYTCSAYI